MYSFPINNSIDYRSNFDGKIVMIEYWKQISEYENYIISNFGNIKNVKTGKFLKFDKNKLGYCRVYLYNSKGRNRFLVHRLVAFHFISNPNNYKIVNHLNCNPSDNRVQNLEWTTNSGNAVHALNNGRLKIPSGEKNGMSVLTEEKVLEIISLWNKGLTQVEISNKMGVTRSCVAHITQGNRWKQHSHLIERKRV